METLQHKKYQNIFVLGDVANLPNTKTTLGSIHQDKVVRNNVLKYLDSLNAKYQFQIKGFIHLSLKNLVSIEHNYNNMGNLSTNYFNTYFSNILFNKKLNIYKNIHKKKSSRSTLNIFGKPIKFN